MVNFYFDQCGETKPVKITIKKDPLNDRPWGDILCVGCCSILATVTTDEPGIYEFVKTGELPG